jgi:hypothetical protein
MSRRQLSLPTPGSRRAVVLGAGSFGTAVAVLLARGGFRTTLQTRTPEQAARLEADRENKEYLSDVALPRELRVEPMAAGLSRADYLFLGVPSRGIAEVIASLNAHGLPGKTPVVSMAKGLAPPEGIAPTALLNVAFGVHRVACIGGPAHAREMVTEGAGLVAASTDARLAATQRPRPGSLRARSGATTPSGPTTKRISSATGFTVLVATQSRSVPGGLRGPESTGSVRASMEAEPLNSPCASTGSPSASSAGGAKSAASIQPAFTRACMMMPSASSRVISKPSRMPG